MPRRSARSRGPYGAVGFLMSARRGAGRREIILPWPPGRGTAGCRRLMSALDTHADLMAERRHVEEQMLGADLPVAEGQHGDYGELELASCGDDPQEFAVHGGAKRSPVDCHMVAGRLAFDRHLAIRKGFPSFCFPPLSERFWLASELTAITWKVNASSASPIRRAVVDN